MHELSVAVSIVEGVTEELQRQGGSAVSAVYLRLGRASGVVRDALLFAYDVACEGTPLAGSQLLITEEESASMLITAMEIRDDDIGEGDVANEISA